MIRATELHYRHTGALNHYLVFFHNQQIGTIRHTPMGPGIWTFTSSSGKVQTFGPTRLQAVGIYIETYFERNELNGQEEQHQIDPLF